MREGERGQERVRKSERAKEAGGEMIIQINFNDITLIYPYSSLTLTRRMSTIDKPHSSCTSSSPLLVLPKSRSFFTIGKQIMAHSSCAIKDLCI